MLEPPFPVLKDPRFEGWHFNQADGRGGLAPVHLERLSPGDQPFANGPKNGDRQRVDQLAEELDVLQEHFYADGRYKLLVVLQGMDTSGKDRTVRSVFNRMSPLGVHTVAFKTPNSTELAYDYLWRVHQRVPRAGEIVIFNRSHYEDVLVPVVEGWIDEDEAQRRYRHLCDFERMLAETGTVIVKCMLHISKDEQKERLQARLDDDQKHWKFDPRDLHARARWNDYQRAYEAALAATATPWAPWTVVPADSKTHRNLMVATLIRDVLQSLDLRYPRPDFDPKSIRID
ncbi:MAG: PPK2 family polyphosphate kinase [Caldimonas sp.]|uniref:PPK2 family polyphosphate kinase n=1 Tax=Caldimonas sp. TaxID=2838790 RepID=UPI003919268A